MEKEKIDKAIKRHYGVDANKLPNFDTVENREEISYIFENGYKIISDKATGTTGVFNPENDLTGDCVYRDLTPDEMLNLQYEVENLRTFPL